MQYEWEAKVLLSLPTLMTLVTGQVLPIPLGGAHRSCQGSGLWGDGREAGKPEVCVGYCA